MSIKTKLFPSNIKKLLSLGFCLFLIISNPANAILLNFDELDDTVVDAEGNRVPLSDEYESQGLVFVGSAYGGGVVAGPGFGFEFVSGNLPTFVSFNLGSPSEIAVDITVNGPNYFKSIVSSGAIVGMTDDPGTPYIPNELFSFYSETGIASVHFSGKAGNYIDNLTYTYTSDVAVPEPSTIILLGLGLLGLFSSRLKSTFTNFSKP